MTSVVGRSGQYWFGFSPSNIPGLALWYDFSDTSTFDLSGDYAIARVRDKSGNGRHGTPSNGAGGLWVYDGVVKSALRYPERVPVTLVLDICLNASEPFMSGGVAVTITGKGATYLVSPTGAGGFAMQFSNTRYEVGTTISSNLSRATGVDDWSTSVCTFSGGNIVANGSGLHPGNISAAPPQGPAGLGVKIGTYAAEFNYGAIHELLLFSNAISPLDRAALDDYLIRKWMRPLTTAISSPTNIPGCTLWLDTSGVASNNFNFATGSNVIKWKDKSGNNYDVSTVGTTTYPVWTTTDTSGMYFPPGAVMNTNVPLPPTGEETGFIVGRKVTNSVVRSLITATAGSTGPSRNITSFTAGDYSLRQNNGSAINSNMAFTSNLITTLRPQLLMWRSKGNEVYAQVSGIPAFYTADISAATNTMGFTTLGPAAHGFREVITYNRALTWDEMSNVEAYIFRKWGISNTKTFTSEVLNTTFNLGTFARTPQLPYDVTGCMLWLDAKDSTSIVLDSSGGVIRWRDKSGFQNDLSSIVVTGISRPTYSNETVTFNSNRMDIRNPLQTSNNFTMYPGLTTTSHSFVALHKPLTITGSNTGNTSLFDFSVIGSATCNVSFPVMTGTTPRGWIWSGNTALNRSGSTLLENSVSTDYNIITASISSLRQRIFNNGVLQRDLSGQSIASYTFNTTAAVSAIGRFGKGNSLYYQGDVKELFVFDRALSLYEVQQMESYIATKWNLRQLLPPNHMVFSNVPVAIANTTPFAFESPNIWLDALYFSSNHSNGQLITSDWKNWGNNSNIRFQAAGARYRSNLYRGRPGIDISTGGFWTPNGDMGLPDFNTLTFAVLSRSKDFGASGQWAITYCVSAGFTRLDVSGPTFNIGGVYDSGYAAMSNVTDVLLASGSDYTNMIGSRSSNWNVPFLVEAYSSPSNLGIAVNGNCIYDVSSWTSFGGGPNLNYMLIGRTRQTTNPPGPWPGNVHEIIMYENRTSPSEDDKLKIRAYLINKWGLRDDIIPTYYPYKGTRI
jgi:hypothetical protein